MGRKRKDKPTDGAPEQSDVFEAGESDGEEEASLDADLDANAHAPDIEDELDAPNDDARMLDVADLLPVDTEPSNDVDSPSAPTLPPPSMPPSRDPLFARPRAATPDESRGDGPALPRPTLEELQDAARAFPLTKVRVRLRPGIASPMRVAGLVLSREWKAVDVRYVAKLGEPYMRSLATSPDIEVEPVLHED